MKDEIDLREYIDVLLRRWKVIVSITVIAVFVAGLVSFLSPSIYEARAAMLITRARSQIVFEPSFETYFTYLKEDIASQRGVLIALSKSRTVATQVIEQLEDKLDPEERKPANILDKVQVREQGDYIEILVRHDDPQTAAAIADAWAESYQSYVNGLYSGISQSPEELQAQADAARKDYGKKQKAWEDFVSSNRVDELSHHIADRKLLCDIKSLREQSEAGSLSSASAAANSLAFILLQTRAATDLPVDFQVFTDQLSSLDVSTGDIDALISTLEARSGGAQGQSISELRQGILQLSGELEQEMVRQQDLKNSRDIVWEAYKTVAGKVVEAEVAAYTQGGVIRVIEGAAVPEAPVGPRKVMNIGIALVLGLVVGVFGAFGVEYFQKTGGNQKEGRKNEE